MRLYRYRFTAALVCELVALNVMRGSVPEFLRFFVGLLIYVGVSMLPCFRGSLPLGWRVACMREGVFWLGRQEDLYHAGKKMRAAMPTPSHWGFFLFHAQAGSGLARIAKVGQVLKGDSHEFIVVHVVDGTRSRRVMTLLTYIGPRPPRRRRRLRERLPRFSPPTMPAFRPGLSPA